MKKVINAKAAGHGILVEMINEGELLGSSLLLGVGKGNEPSKQAFIRDVGPLIMSQEKPCGLNVGDRVLLQGSYTPLPIKTDNDRTLGIVDLHNIKAVLTEEN
jgi:hypothetical protein